MRARALRREELQSDPSAHAHAARALKGLRGRKSPRRTRRPQTGAFKEGRSEGSSARLLQEDPVAPDMSLALHRKPATCAEAFTKSTNSGGAFSALHLQTPSRDSSTSTAPRLQACHTCHHTPSAGVFGRNRSRTEAPETVISGQPSSLTRMAGIASHAHSGIARPVRRNDLHTERRDSLTSRWKAQVFDGCEHVGKALQASRNTSSHRAMSRRS